MKFDAFIGGSYESQAYTADQERTVNWYPEQLQSKGATAARALYPTPGVETVLAVTVSSPGRAHGVFDGREFAVVGGRFCEFDNTSLLRAKLTTGGNNMAIDGYPATIDSNGDGGGQVFVTTGGNAYVYDLAADTLTGVTPVVTKAHFGGYLDSYFIVLDTNDSRFYVSDSYDGLNWTTGNAKRSLAADPWRSMLVAGRAVWLYGEFTSEVWYNTGDRFPFAPHPSGLIQYGILAPRSAKVVDDDVIWLATTRGGKHCVMRSTGLEPQRISTYALETALQGYAGVTEAIADTYSESGHTFYLLSFDAHGVTWAWDRETGLWSERGTWDPALGRYTAWRPRFHARAFGEHRMLDRSNGSLYRMSGELVQDVDGNPIRRTRRAPAMNDEMRRVFYPEFELDLEPAVATTACPDPQVMLRISNDGGKTWPAELWRSAGKTGEYFRRVRWNRLGMGRRRVFEVTVSDPVAWKIVGAYLRASGAQVQGRTAASGA